MPPYRPVAMRCQSATHFSKLRIKLLFDVYNVEHGQYLMGDHLETLEVLLPFGSFIARKSALEKTQLWDVLITDNLF